MPDDTGPFTETFPQGSPASYLAPGESGTELEFDEAAYLRAFPDVAEAIDRGDLTSGLEHYLRAGRGERRLLRPEYFRQMAQIRAAAAVAVPTVAQPAKSAVPAASIDAFVVAESGAVFVVGWVDDQHNPLVAVSLGPERRAWTLFPRLRRQDVEVSLQGNSRFHYGFWLFAGAEEQAAPRRAAGAAEQAIELRFANGGETEIRRAPSIVSDAELRDIVMTYFAGVEYWGNRSVEAFEALDRGAGEALVAFNRSISRGIVAGATKEQFGPRLKRPKGSIIVPLYGISDYLFLQSCTYAHGPGIEDYEFIYVVNSPELIEKLHREARIAEAIYGLSQTLVFLPGNSGFGAANNVALQFAQSDRLLCVNPDVFPQQRNWAARHTELVATLPPVQTRLFGATLYYDDGSLMHGGMYFDADVGIHTTPSKISRRPLLRVEHYGKGAPPWATQFTASRPVPAVTGAFISVERAWFEKLGGFTEDYVFGHYEDADLCLKSLQAGTAPWLHELRMWHLEGKGSRKLPQHEGGSLVNRWLFSRTWAAFIQAEVSGQHPRHKLLQAGGETRPTAAPSHPTAAPPRPVAPPRNAAHKAAAAAAVAGAARRARTRNS
jgi:GT2 family glycosyltransferase